MNAGEVCFGEHPSVQNLILPFDVEEFSEAHSVEVVQLNGMAAVHSPGFASMQEGWNHYSLVDLQFGLKSDSLFMPILVI